MRSTHVPRSRLLQECRRYEITIILNRIKRLKAESKDWWPSRDTQSAQCFVEKATSRAQVHFRLEFCLLEMFSGRPFILADSQQRSHTLREGHVGQTRPRPHANPAPCQCLENNLAQSSPPWEFLVRDCVGSAEETIQLCLSLKSSRIGLARSSYIEYSACRASLLVLIAYSIFYRTTKFSGPLRTGLSVIKEMVSSGDSARYEVDLLETLESALHRLHALHPAYIPSTANSIDTCGASGYEGFLNWYTQRGLLSSVDNPQDVDVQARETAQRTDRDNITGSISDGFEADVATSNAMCDARAHSAFEDLALFTSNFGEYGVSDRDLLDSLLWIQNKSESAEVLNLIYA